MPIEVDERPLNRLSPLSEFVDTRLMTWDPGFVRFRENKLNASQDVWPVEQSLKQIDLSAFDIDL